MMGRPAAVWILCLCVCLAWARQGWAQDYEPGQGKPDASVRANPIFGPGAGAIQQPNSIGGFSPMVDKPPDGSQAKQAERAAIESVDPRAAAPGDSVIVIVRVPAPHARVDVQLVLDGSP